MQKRRLEIMVEMLKGRSFLYHVGGIYSKSPVLGNADMINTHDMSHVIILFHKLSQQKM